MVKSFMKLEYCFGVNKSRLMRFNLRLKFNSHFVAVKVTFMSIITTLLFIQQINGMLWFKCRSRAETFVGRKLFAKT
jgi:hypothetical protein